MGVIGKILGSSGAVTALGATVKDVSEVFTANATRRMELSAEAQAAALAQHGAEFATAGEQLFDRIVNGMNRLPRPMLAFGTLGLFVYAMIDPPGFGTRMVGLNHVPEPLWWLLGAIVSFYFGAREAYYFRNRTVAAPAPAPESPAASAVTEPANLALEDWRKTAG
jgi:hypothetical protein